MWKAQGGMATGSGKGKERESKKANFNDSIVYS
jgi:hypothetical protein